MLQSAQGGPAGEVHCVRRCAQVLEDVSAEHANKTITIEPHPHSASAVQVGVCVFLGGGGGFHFPATGRALPAQALAL